ncbi:MAG TPA: DEAD/DEAH box helicase [Beutenbergiaceae bacterium]|nr:DEAD/DEAH box helicase [Beutenbergiaceae bacterium]
MPRSAPPPPDVKTAALDAFSPATRSWFASAFQAPTPAQEQAWQAMTSGDHALVVAPTGSGKTLAAFLSALDSLLTGEEPAERIQRCRVVYVSPLKALAADVERNLRSPLVGITQAATSLGAQVRDVQVGVRTGDTPAAERRAFGRTPPDILITTPESLFLILTSAAREGLRGVQQVIIDEVHALAGNKRGAHLALSLERLDALTARPVQRVGLSATVRPPEAVAQYLAGSRTETDGGRPVQVVAPPIAKHVDIDVALPVPDLTDIAGTPVTGSAQADSPERTAATDTIASSPPSAGRPGGSRAEQTRAEPSPLADEEIDLSGAAAGRLPELRHRAGNSIWPHLTERLTDLITAHQATIVFTNSRRGAERLTAQINECHAARLGLTDPDSGAAQPAQVPGQSGASVHVPPEAVIARAHHGSMSRDERTSIESALKSGRLPAVVATSSLELGIDMGAVDLVVQVGAPPSVASTLQRIGRAGHQVGETSRGVVLPAHRGDLLAAAATAARARAGRIEQVRIPANPLDVLAQQVVAATAMEAWAVDDLFTLVRRATPFSTLPESIWHAVLDMLSGRYPSEDFAELRPRLVWDRHTGILTARPGALRLAVTSGGTIPDRGMYGVYLVGAQDPRRGGKRVGELDEEMVFESRVGDTFTLGSSTWRIEDITPDRVLVSPAPGLPGRLPFWKGDAPPRPAELGRAFGAMVRELMRAGGLTESTSATPAQRSGQIADAANDTGPLLVQGLDEWARENLLTYLREQEQATGVVPTDKTLVVEQFRDELGDWRVAIHSPYGAAVHAPWALVLANRLRDRFGLDAQVMHADDGIVLRLPDTSWQEGDERALLDLDDLLLDPEEARGLVVSSLASSAHFAARFREAAARSLLLPRRRPDRRQPLWQQRQRSAQLLSVAGQYSDFPVVLEAVRECLQDDFDIDALTGLMRALHQREVRIVQVDTPTPSPFAQSLVFGYIAQFLYDGDAPLAERRAAALSLDARLLGELLGEGTAVADLLDADAVASVEAQVGLRTETTRARDAEGLVDLIRRLGPVPEAELAPRSTEPDAVPTWLADLQAARRVIRVRIAGQDQWAIAEDAGRLRDALGVALPTGLPEEFTRPAPEALEQLVRRHARTHGPFRAGQVATRFGLGIGAITPVLHSLVEQGVLTSGELRPTQAHSEASAALAGPDYCDADVLRRIRRRSLAALRAEVEPVPPAALGVFAPRWHQVDRLRGVEGVLSVVEQLAGTPIAASAWETLVLPARVRDYTSAMLDELTGSGEVVWVGVGSGPGSDGLVTLLPADAVADLAPEPDEQAVATPLHRAILRALAGGGVFFRDLLTAVRADGAPMDSADDLIAPMGGGDGHGSPAGADVDQRDLQSAPPADHPGAPAAGQGEDGGGAADAGGDRTDPAGQVHEEGGPTSTADLGAVSTERLVEALWDLVWAGLVTNDSMAPLRVHLSGSARPGTPLSAVTRARARPRSLRSALRTRSLRATGGAVSTPPLAAGRWSLVGERSGTDERLVAKVLSLVDRDGILTRGAVEGVPGGFATAYRILAQAEENGQVRRGYFVEGLGAAQFALAECIERLRADAGALERRTHEAILLAATDPANPYGAALPWPPASGETTSAHRPGRKVGASVVLVDGALVLYLERGARTLLSFTDDDAPLLAATAELAEQARAGVLGRLTVQRADGAQALGGQSPLLAALQQVGFIATPRGLRMRQGGPASPRAGAADSTTPGRSDYARG